ncbi:MAG: type II secretion system protein [Planctomycetales bacterium]|nr:type II secretion system protein [Planctomycetales bacterium]
MRLRTALSLTELLAVLGVISVLAVLIVPRVADRTGDAEREACYLNQGEIELQCQLWRRANGSFPLSILSDIGGNSAYFPEGLPTCPVDGTAYTIDSTTGQVTGHSH